MITILWFYKQNVLFLKDTYWNTGIEVSCLQWTLKWFRKRKKKESKKEIWKKKKEKKRNIHRGREKREGGREKENLAHLVSLGGEYMGVHFTILATFLKVRNFAKWYAAE